jgi:hypothetical protein
MVNTIKEKLNNAIVIAFQSNDAYEKVDAAKPI